MIKLSNGHVFKYMTASGALAFDGKGWPWERPLVRLGLIKPELSTIVIKTLTRNPRLGNLRWWKPWTCISLIPGGAVNKIGLTNRGIDWWCNKIGPHLDFKKYSIVASIFGDEQELVEMTKMLNPFDLVGIEVNPSCPNSGEKLQTAEFVIKMVKSVKAVSKHPVIIKVSVDQDYLAIALGLKGIAEAISINSVPWKTAFPNGEISPLHRLEKKVGGGGGGVSGKPAQKFNWKAVEALAQQGIIPVIGPSVMEFEDLNRVRKLGASAVSFGTIYLKTPCKPTKMIERESYE